METENRLKLFVNELNEISDEKMRKFAEDLIVNADDYFFTIAASTTGKYHPQFDLGNGGLVRHTRCVVFFAICEATSRCFDEHEKDMLIVAAIAHDIKKLGDGSGKYTVPDHPKWAAEYVLNRQAETKLITKKDATVISNIVYSHMGKWGAEDGMPMPKTDLEKALQSADYIASRKEILGFDFKPTENVQESTQNNALNENVNSNSVAGDYVFTFGKHSGKTIKEVYEIEKSNLSNGYLTWMINKDDFNKVEARNNALLFFKELGILPERFLKEVENLEVKTPEVKIPEIKAEVPVEFKETDPGDDLPF